MTLRELLLEHYLTWQRELREEKTWKEFAEMIGLDHVYLNKIYNGKRNAGEKTITILADYFDDPRFYDVAGLDRPDPFLSYTKRNWGNIPQDERMKIACSVAKYSTEPMPKERPE